MTHAPAAGQIRIALDDGSSVSGLLLAPPDSRACYVFAHGAGAGMAHPFMTAVAGALARHGVATLRYQFPYMENATKRPDPPRTAHATVRAAVAEAARRLPALPLIAGGKSFGARMTSQAQALEPLPGVRGLAFIGFPLHAAKQPSTTRAEHFGDVRVPMLFLQGTRDALAELALIRSVASALGERATLAVIDDADHAFHVRKSSGRGDDAVVTELAQVIVDWIGREQCGG